MVERLSNTFEVQQQSLQSVPQSQECVITARTSLSVERHPSEKYVYVSCIVGRVLSRKEYDDFYLINHTTHVAVLGRNQTLSLALNGSSMLQHFEHDNTVEICNGIIIIFDFYPGLQHMHT